MGAVTLSIAAAPAAAVLAAARGAVQAKAAGGGGAGGAFGGRRVGAAPGGQRLAGVCFVRNCLMRGLAASSAAPVFHSEMNSASGSNLATSSEIGYGCASSLPASTRQGVRQPETKARSTL